MRPSLLRSQFTLVLVIPAIFLAGCVSTQKRYEKGLRLESDGRYAEAADYYVKVLRKAPDWPDARNHLMQSGEKAVEDYLAAARAHEEAGRYEQAVLSLDRLDALRSRAAAVGIAVAVPEDYVLYREEMTEGAVISLIRRGERAEEAADWPAALRAYDRVQQRYRLEPFRLAELNEARGRVMMGWGESDLARRRFRSAFERAERAIHFSGPYSPLGQAAIELQEEALERGTRRIAFLPVASTEGVQRDAPRGLVESFGNTLQYEFWAQPPLFLETVDPAELHRMFRRHRHTPESITERSAVEIGRAVGADLVVLVDVARFLREEADLKEERKKARTRGRNALDTVFVVQRFRETMKAEAAYAIVDVASRNVVDRGTARAESSLRRERGRYAGNPADLDLSRRDRRYFDIEAEREAERELVDQLLDDLAARLARDVFTNLLRHIP
jgi:tetratricopeptide (TPR) repeat protein